MATDEERIEQLKDQLMAQNLSQSDIDRIQKKIEILEARKE